MVPPLNSCRKTLLDAQISRIKYSQKVSISEANTGRLYLVTKTRCNMLLLLLDLVDCHDIILFIYTV